MNERVLRRLDGLSATLLILWLGMALGFVFLQTPATFKMLASRDLAGQVMDATLARLDWAAWVAFLLALALSWGSRWLVEFRDPDRIGPLRIWSAVALVALLMCFSSSFIVTPKLAAVRNRQSVSLETLAEDHPDRVRQAKAHRVSIQFLGFRMALALGLAIGVVCLPRKKE